MMLFAVCSLALVAVVARIAWTSYHNPTRRLQRASKRAQRALKAVSRGE